jgi:hypothetical protein
VRKIAPKIVRYTMTGVNIVMVMVLGACMKPVDINPFLEDETVQGIIESTKVAVIVDDQTGDGLVGRDRRIEGLKKDKYYMVEQEKDAEGAPVSKYNNAYSYPVYVSDHPIAIIPGGLYPDLGFITRIEDGRINGLLNDHTYTVRAAEPLVKNGFLPYADGSGSSKIPVINGEIKITSITGTGSLNLSDIDAGTEVMAVTVNSTQSSLWNWVSRIPTSAEWASFVLEGSDTTVDYVFVKKFDYLPPRFNFLRVIIGPSKPSVTPDKITLDIKWSIDEIPIFDPPDYTFYQTDYYGKIPKQKTINVSNPGNIYTNMDWQYNDDSIGFPLEFDNLTGKIDYLVEGKHVFTLVFTIKDKWYSVDFTLVVKDKP